MYNYQPKNIVFMTCYAVKIEKSPLQKNCKQDNGQHNYHSCLMPGQIFLLFFSLFLSLSPFFLFFFIPWRSRRDIVLAASVHSVRPSTLFVCLEPYLNTHWSDFDSFLVQMISTMDFRYPISLIKMDPLTLELLPLFWYRQL